MISYPDYKNFIRHDLFLGFLLARGFKCECAYDVGAYQGDWTKWFYRRWPEAKVYMFEALEEMAPKLNEICETYQNAELISMGIGDQDSELEFTIWDSLSGSSLMPQPGQKWDSLQKRKINVSTIDTLLSSQKIKIPQMAKLDVQGYELKALEGATKLFGQTEVFVLEVSLYHSLGSEQPVASDVIKFMAERDYVLFDIIGTYRRPVDHALEQVDMVFVPKDSSLRDPKPLELNIDFDF